MCIWVIKVTFLNNNQVNFNEGYKTYNECISAIKKKIEPDNMRILSDFIIRDIENEIEYEAKTVEVY